jgi:hypothetical protein
VSLQIVVISGCKFHSLIANTSKHSYRRSSFANQSSYLSFTGLNRVTNQFFIHLVLSSATPLPALLLLSLASRYQSADGPNFYPFCMRLRYRLKRHIAKSASTSSILCWKLLSRASRSIYRASSNYSRIFFGIPRAPKFA